MWKNGKEGNTEGRRIMEGKEGRRETIEAEEKTEPRKKGGCGIAARGTARTFGRGLRRSTVAHFARKVMGANIVAAKHELKIQQSHVPERWSCSLRVRGPHFASKVSYNAGAATDDYAALTQISAARALLPIFNLEHPKVIRWPSILLLFSECPPAFGRASSRVR
mgnify:CR=1 FL=1